MGNIIDEFKKRRADRLNEKAISAYKSRRDARMAEKRNDDKWITIGASKGGSFVDENGNRVEEKPHKGIHILVSENGIAKGGAGGQFNGQDFSKAKSLPPEAGLEKMKAEEKAEKAKKEGKVEEAKAQEAKAQEIENETATSPVEEQKEVTGENISPKEEAPVEPAEEASENSFQTPDEFSKAKSEGEDAFKSYLAGLPVGAGFMVVNIQDGSAKLKKIDDNKWEYEAGEEADNSIFSDSELVEQWDLVSQGDVADINSGEVLSFPEENEKSNLEKFQSAVETKDAGSIKKALETLEDGDVFGVIVNGNKTYFKKNNGFFNGYSENDQDWVTWGATSVGQMAKIISESKLEGVDITSSPDDNKKPVEEEAEGNIGDFANTIVEDKEAGIQMLQEMPEGTEIEFTDASFYHNFIKKNEDGSWDCKVDAYGVVTHYEDVDTDVVAGLIHNSSNIKVNNSGEGKEAEETNPESEPFGGEPETEYDKLGQDIENKLVTAEKGEEIVPLMDKIQVGDTLRYFDGDVEINATKNENGLWDVTFNGEYPEHNISPSVLAGAMIDGEISGVKISKENQNENAQENPNQAIQENEQLKEIGENQEFVNKLANLTDEDDVEGVVEDYLSSLPVGAVIISHDGHGLWTYTKTGNTWNQENPSGAKVEGSYSDDIAHWVALGYIGGNPIIDGQSGKPIAKGWGKEATANASNEQNVSEGLLDLQEAVNNKEGIEAAVKNLEPNEVFGIGGYDESIYSPDGYVYLKKAGDGQLYKYSFVEKKWKQLNLVNTSKYVQSTLLNNGGLLKVSNIPQEVLGTESQTPSKEKEFESKLKDAMGSSKNITSTENVLKTAEAGTIVSSITNTGTEITAKKESDGTWTINNGDHIMLDTSDNQVAAMLADSGNVSVEKLANTASNLNSSNQQQSAPKTENGISYESIAQNLKEYKSQLNPSDFKDELKAMDEGSTINATIGGNDVTLTKNPSGNGWEGSDGNHYSSTTIANKVMQGSIGIDSIGNGKGWSMSLSEKAPEQKKIEFTEETSKAANDILKEYNELVGSGKTKPVTKAKKLTSSAVEGSTIDITQWGYQQPQKYIKDAGKWYKVKDDGTIYKSNWSVWTDEEIAEKIKYAKNSEFFGALDTTPKSKILNVSNNMTAEQKEFIKKNAGKGSAATYHMSQPSKNNVVFDKSEFSDSAKSKAVWGAHGLDDNKIIKQLKPKFDEAWANLSQAEKNAVKEYTGNYSKYNEPMYGVKYAGQKNSSMQTINALTSAISKSVIDKPQYVDHYCGIATINGMLKFGGHNTINSGDYESLVGKEIVNAAFTSGACADGSGYKKDRPFKLHIYLPKGAQTFFAEPISSFGTAEFETIVQRGSHYKVTGVSKNYWGQITVNCELVSQDPKPYDIINGVAIYG